MVFVAIKTNTIYFSVSIGRGFKFAVNTFSAHVLYTVVYKVLLICQINNICQTAVKGFHANEGSNYRSGEITN